MKHLMKFHDSAKKDLLITITMDECLDFEDGESAETEKDTED